MQNKTINAVNSPAIGTANSANLNLEKRSLGNLSWLLFLVFCSCPAVPTIAQEKSLDEFIADIEAVSKRTPTCLTDDAVLPKRVLVTSNGTAVFDRPKTCASNGNEILILPGSSTLYCLCDGELVASQVLPRHSCLVARSGKVQIRASHRTEPFVLVDVLGDGTCFAGWICIGDVLNLKQWHANIDGIAPPSVVPTALERQTMPALILIQGEQLRMAWQEMVQSANANMQLPATERLPDPFLARAEIWSIVGNHSAALRNNLWAAEVLQARGNDLVDFAKYFVILKEALDRHDRSPVPRFIPAALEYWIAGKAEFRSGCYDKALPEFVNAVQLNPENPLFWYYRSLTYKALGKDREAVHDAKVGSRLEHRLRVSGRTAFRRYVQNLGKRLEQVQGPTRIWLEGFRQGKSASWATDGLVHPVPTSRNSISNSDELCLHCLHCSTGTRTGEEKQ